MEEVKKNTDKQAFQEEESSFDLMEWVMHFVSHWYLFLIGLFVTLTLSYMQNRKWLPEFKSTATVIIDESRSMMNSAQVLMQGFGIQESYRNVNNQVIMIASYDLMGRVVDSLPLLQTEYISKGRFKTRNLYDSSPIYIETEYVSPEAYGILFKISIKVDGTYTITEEEDRLPKGFKITGRFGELLQNHLMFLTVYDANDTMADEEMYFRFRTKESLIDEFSGRLNLNFVMEGSSILEISMTSQTPQRDVDFINKLCEIYLMSNLERKNDAATNTINFIDEQLEHVSKSLATSEDDLTSFRKKNQLIDVGSLSGELLNKATAYDNELNQIRLKETYLTYLDKYIRTNLSEGAIIAPTSLGLNEPMLMALVQQINDLIIKRSELSEKNMFHAKYTRDIENVKVAINEVVKNMQTSNEIQRQDLNRRLAEVQGQIENLPEKELEMIGIERNYRMNDSYYTMFLQKRAEAQILKASNTPDNNILDRARTIAVTNQGAKSKTTMIFLVLGILLPAGYVVLKELLNNTIRTSKDVEKFCVFPLIGLVRHTNSESPYIVADNPRSSFTEMFRVIRTRIEFLAKRKSDITIMVTSSESGDGKTYFCINMACVYAMASPKTLLVDMDIRKPSVYKRLGVENNVGVSNYLANQCTLDEIIIRPPGAEFDFITAGTVPPNAGELIRSENLVKMFEELRKRYEFIIVDTSPIGVVADAYSFASLSDINLFVIRSNKTNKMFVRNLSNQLKDDNVNQFYSVLNDVEVESSSYSQYYSRKYAYGKSKSYGLGAYGYGYGYGYTSSGSKDKNKKSDTYFEYYQDDKKEI
ncbi:MAG: polysaccharide biosynthesis tyrosine autokinase [Paludibacter sp.]|nr:polysaccharide biosynthesis tyrosine autokinase [Paludibacter sp.]MDD4426894.1 polysaccharide biosynthesis tyrosine autokinase [Paludibacter sp.]